MEPFLDRVYFDNEVRAYLIVLGVIAAVLLMKRFISRYIAGLIFRFVKRIWKDVDRKSFSDLVVQPLGLFVLILVTIIAFNKLHFPARLNVDIYRYTTSQLLHTGAKVILIV